MSRMTDKTDYGRDRMNDKKSKAPYERPQLTRHEGLKDLTRECPAWQCSVTVPGAPQQP